MSCEECITNSSAMAAEASDYKRKACAWRLRNSSEVFTFYQFGAEVFALPAIEPHNKVISHLRGACLIARQVGFALDASHVESLHVPRAAWRAPIDLLRTHGCTQLETGLGVIDAPLCEVKCCIDLFSGSHAQRSSRLSRKFHKLSYSNPQNRMVRNG